MKTIRVLRSRSTGLIPSLNTVHSLDIEDTPIGQGGFGVVHRVTSVDGKTVEPLVVKLLMGADAVARRGYDTVQELQQRLHRYHASLSQRQSLISKHPALAAVPQLSFEGDLERAPVLGYAANDLGAMGMEELGNVLADGPKLTRLQGQPLVHKMTMALQLVDALDILNSRILFLHADLKDAAIFVNIDRGACALIDFDSGALARDAADKPTTFGTRQDWLAPEILRQLDRPVTPNGGPVRVDVYSDVWSANCAVHYLLTGLPPFFFLNEVSDRSMRAYQAQYQWPDAGPRCTYFRSDLAHVHFGYLQYLKRGALPKEWIDRLAFTFNRGYFEPANRTSYSQWRTTFAQQTRPEILKFKAGHTCNPISKVLPKEDEASVVELEWDVEGDAMVVIKPLVGAVGCSGSRLVTLFSDTTFTLEATSPFGVRSVAQVHVQTPQVRLTRLIDRLTELASRSRLLPKGSDGGGRWATAAEACSGANRLKVARSGCSPSDQEPA